MMCLKSGGGGFIAKSCLTLATPWTVACQAPQSVGLSRQEHWSGLPLKSAIVELPHTEKDQSCSWSNWERSHRRGAT